MTMPQLTRNSVCLLGITVAMGPEGHSRLCERVRAKVRVLESVHRLQGLLVVTMVARKRRSSSCVAGTLSRTRATVVHRNGMYIWLSLLSFPL